MKCVRRIGRSPKLVSLLLIGLAIDVLSSQQAALSQLNYSRTIASVDYVCYMQTSDGQVINLSRMCGKSRPTTSETSTLSIGEQSFIERYKSFLAKRAGTPGVQAIIAQSQKNPQSVIQRAQAVCSAIRYGLSQSTSGQVDDDLLQSMAPKYFCPELDD